MARKLRYNDEEGGMVKAQLQKIEMYAAKLNDMIHPDDEIEGWVQAKLAVVAAYMGDVKHYLDYELKENFADGGGVKMNERYWEVEFTWDGEPEGDGRKVTVMADSVSEAEKKVKEKFGAYYKGLRIVEVEEDKPISEMYKDDDDDDDDKDDDDDFPKKRYRKMSDGGIYNEPYITYQELWDKLKAQGHQFDNEVDFAVVANKLGYTWDDDAEQWFQMANGGVTDAAYKRRMKKWGFQPYGKTKGKFKVTYEADGEPQTEIWETKEMAIAAARKYAKMDEFTNPEVFDENGNKIMASGGELIGNQKKLDLNKNGKLDAEDFRMLRERKKARSKMAKGGEMKQWKVVYETRDGDTTAVWTYANNEDQAIDEVQDEYWDIEEIISVQEMKSDGGDLDFMKDFEKNFTTAYVLQTKQELENKQAQEPYYRSEEEPAEVTPRKKRWYEFADGGTIESLEKEKKILTEQFSKAKGVEQEKIYEKLKEVRIKLDYARRDMFLAQQKKDINKKIVDFVKTLERDGLVAKDAHKNEQILDLVKRVVSMSSEEFSSYIKTLPKKSVANIKFIYSEYQDWQETYADGGKTKEPAYVEIAKPTDLSLNKIRRKVEELADMGYRSGDILLKMLFTTDEPSALTNQFQKLKNRVFFLKDIKKYKNGGKMEDYIRNEGSSWAEDFAEAKEYLGDEIWNEMSREDKIQAVNYLKAKGRIGYGPEFEDLATVAAMQYKRGGKS